VSRPPSRSISGFALTTLVLTASLTACGGDSAGHQGAATESSRPPLANLSSESLATISEYTGVPPGKAADTPITVGLINAETGPGASPELSLVAAEAVRTVNDDLGGVRGHPIQLKTCQPADAAQAQQCANQFVNDPRMVAAIQGSVDIDLRGFHETMSPRVPLLGAFPLSPVDAAAANSYYLANGQLGSLGLVTFARDYVKARSVALISVEGSPAAELAATTIKSSLERSDIDVRHTRFPSASPDLVPSVMAANVAGADLLIPAITTPLHCINLSKALEQLGVGTPVAAFTGCLGSEVRKSLGDYPHWNYLGFSLSAEASTFDDVSAWQVRAFNEWFAPLDELGVTRNDGVQMFQTVLALVKILNSIPGDSFDPAAAGQQMKKFTGPVYLGVNRVAFGAVPQQPAIGSLASRVYTYLGNETWRDATGGVWLEPPIPPPSR
jgi:branched-chain amino acid transport system substrate-binding protein